MWTLIAGPPSLLPTIRRRAAEEEAAAAFCRIKEEKVELKVFPGHLMSESSDAAIDSLKPQP